MLKEELLGCSCSALAFKLIILQVIGTYKAHRAVKEAALDEVYRPLSSPKFHIANSNFRPVVLWKCDLARYVVMTVLVDKNVVINILLHTCNYNF